MVGTDNKVAAKTVTLGATEGERVAVLTGVSPGDKVVVDGADRLKEGMEVDPQFPTQTPGSGPAEGLRPHVARQAGSRRETGGREPGTGDGEHKHWKPAGDSN